MDQQQQWTVKEIDKYAILNKIIGKGNQAIVFEAYRKDNNLPVAAKVFDRSIMDQEFQTKSIIRQIQIQKSIKHPYILEVFDVRMTPNNIYFFMEYCNGGDLEKYLADNKFISESDCIDLFKQIVQAFTLLEENNIVHRDLKPANILLKNGQLKIADFGFAKEISPSDVKNTFVGSPIFMCPQAFQEQNKYDLKKGDVWSAGVCLYLMLYKKYPFYSTSLPDLIETLKQQKLQFLDNENQRSDAIKDLLSHMLDKNESTRYTWKEVAEHKCLKAGSQYQNNPLQGSMEMNQVSGISNFNSELKDVKLQVEEPKMQTEEQTNPPQQQQQQTVLPPLQNQPSQKYNLNTIKQIHSILRLQSQFALIYRIIWKGFFQLISQQSQQYNQQQQQIQTFNSDRIRNAIFLLITALLYKENKFLRDLVVDARACVEFRIKEHKLQNISKEDLDIYFKSEVFLNFLPNLKQTYISDTQPSIANHSDHLYAQLIAAGFTEAFTDTKCNSYIEMSLNIIEQQIQEMSKEALQLDNKTYIILLLYTFFLKKKERRLQQFTDPVAHYQKLLKQMEAINFMNKSQIYDQIQAFIAQDNKDSNQDDDDEMEDEEEEDEIANRFS